MYNMVIETVLGLTGVLAIGAGFVVLRNRRKNIKVPELPEIPEYLVVISRGKEHLKKIAQLLTQIKEKDVCDLAMDLGLAAQKIYDNLKTDPRDLGIVRTFDYHAQECAKLVENYIYVFDTPASPARDLALANCKKVMQEMKVTFEAFYKKCFENEVDGLAVSSETVRRVGQVERPIVRN